MNPESNRSMNMSDPNYRASLTDPQSEIDDHLQEIRKICDRYKLPYFLVINHPAPSGESWTTQMAAKVYGKGDAYGLFSTVGVLLSRASDGVLEVAPTDKIDGDDFDPKDDDKFNFDDNE